MIKKPDEERQFLIFNEGGELGVDDGMIGNELIVGKQQLIESLEEIGEEAPDKIDSFRVFEVQEILVTVAKMVVSLIE